MMGLMDQEDQQEHFEEMLQQQQQQQQQHFHVLAVDDSVIDRKLLEKLLTVSSYHVTCVESGNKALEYLGLLDNLDSSNNTTVLPSSSSSSSSSSASQQQMQDLKVHLIMTDYCMPGMSGYDLLQRVKQSSLKDVPVVVMSSENEPSTINMCLEGGADEFLLKPVQLSDVKKLQCHLLKPLSSNYVDCGDNNIEDINNNAYKRKALPPELSERRSKCKAQPMV